MEEEDAEEFASSLRQRARQVAKSQHFERAVVANILFYGALIGIEQTLRSNGMGHLWVVSVMESLFLVLFMGELAVRLLARGLRASFSDASTVFDGFLLISGVIYHWVISPFFSNDRYLAPVMTLRLLRVLRIVRTLALCKYNREFQVITRSFLNSTNLTCFIFGVLLLILYIFAAVGVELIGFGSDGDEPAEYIDIASKHFGSIPVALLTLMQFTCRDNMAGVYWPLIDHKPWLAIYFVCLVFAVSIVLMAVVAAVISNATTSRDQDIVNEETEKEWKELMFDLKDIFADLDDDNSGMLSREEIVTMDATVKGRLCRAVGCDNPLDIFVALDKDGSGTVSINEFFDGLMDIILARTPLALKRMEKKVESMNWRLVAIFDTVCDLQRSLQAGGVIPSRRPSVEPSHRERQSSMWSSSRSQVAGSSDDILKDMQDLHAVCSADSGQNATDDVVARIQTDMRLLEDLPLSKSLPRSSDLLLSTLSGAGASLSEGPTPMPTGQLQKSHSGKRQAGPGSLATVSSASRARRKVRAATPEATVGQCERPRRPPSRPRRQRSRGPPSPRTQEGSGEAAAAGLHRPEDEPLCRPEPPPRMPAAPFGCTVPAICTPGARPHAKLGSGIQTPGGGDAPPPEPEYGDYGA